VAHVTGYDNADGPSHHQRHLVTKASMIFPPHDMLGRARAALCCLALAGAATADAAVDNVRPFSGQYEGQKKVAMIMATAKAQVELRRSARFIMYTMNSTVTWSVLERKFRECSVMRVDGDRLLPLEYAHIDEADPKHNVRTRFDWKEKKATTLLGKSPEPLTTPIAWPAWDPMSFQVALISQAQKRAAGESEKHQVVERGVLKDYQVKFSGAAPLMAKGQRVQAHEVIGRKASGGQVALYLWPEQSWRPLKIVIDDVAVELTNPAAASAASPGSSALPEEQTPQCSPGKAP
jgi:Protein of unknown function (DUF3108)